MDVEKIVTVYAWDSDAIHSIYRHYLHRIASLSYKEKQSRYANSFLTCWHHALIFFSACSD